MRIRAKYAPFNNMQSSDQEFKCNFLNCTRSFGTRYNLRRHIMARHLKIKNFTCEICGLKLASKQTKQEHMYRHSGEQPYLCPFPGCFQTFRQSSQRSVHAKLHHSQNLPYSLPLPPVSETRKCEQEGIKLVLHPLLGYSFTSQ